MAAADTEGTGVSAGFFLCATPERTKKMVEGESVQSMDITLIIAMITLVITCVMAVLDLIKFCFYLFFESSKKEK